MELTRASAVTVASAVSSSARACSARSSSSASIAAVSAGVTDSVAGAADVAAVGVVGVAVALPTSRAANPAAATIPPILRLAMKAQRAPPAIDAPRPTSTRHQTEHQQSAAHPLRGDPGDDEQQDHCCDDPDDDASGRGATSHEYPP